MKRLKHIVDTDIFIDHLRGYEPSKGYMQQFEDGQLYGMISTVTILELYAGKRMYNPDEVDKVEQIISIFEEVSVDAKIGRKAGEFIRKYGGAIPDAIIAATAVVKEAIVITRNIKHYTNISEVDIEKPYD